MGLAILGAGDETTHYFSTFSSLFIGMGLAIAVETLLRGVTGSAFSSLFIGMGLAIIDSGRLRSWHILLSVPFSSGWALRL